MVINQFEMLPRSRPLGGANFVIVDGSVRFLSLALDHQTHPGLGCRHDDQVTRLP